MKSEQDEKTSATQSASDPEYHPVEVEEEAPILPYQAKRKSWLGRIFGFCFRIALYLFLVLIALGFLVVYYFPADAIRPYAEQELSRLLKMPVNIGEVKINLLRGVEIREVALGGEEPLFNVQALILDYDLSDLIWKQKLLINEVTIDRPWINLRSVNGVWNFQPLLDLAKPKEKQTKEEKPPTKSIAPPIPFEIDLKHFAIKDITLDLNQDGMTKVHLEGLTLKAEGQANRDGLALRLQVLFSEPKNPQSRHNLIFSTKQGEGLEARTLLLSDLNIFTQDLNSIKSSGSIRLSNTRIKAKQKLPTPDLAMNYVVDVSLKEELLEFHRLIIDIDKINRIKLSIKAQQFLSNPEFKLNLSKAVFDIKSLIQLGRPWLPPVSSSGKIEIRDLKVTGKLSKFQPEEISIDGGKLILQNVHFFYESLAAELTGLNIDLNLNQVLLKNGVPENADVDLKLTIQQGRFGEIAFDQLDQKIKLAGQGKNLSDITLDFTTQLKKLKVSLPQLAFVQTSLKLNGNGNGNWVEGNLPNFKLDYDLGGLTHGKLNIQARDFGKASLKIDQQMHVTLNRIPSLLPRKLKKDLKGLALKGKADIDLSFNGKLDKNFQPTEAQAKVKLKLVGVDTQLIKPVAVNIKNLSATLDFPVAFNSRKGIKISTLDLKVAFNKLNALGKWNIGATKISDHLTMKKFYNFKKPGGMIPITNKLKLESASISSTEPKLSLTNLKVETNTKVDLASEKDWRNLTLEGKVSLAKVAALEMVNTGKLTSSFKVDVRDATLTRMQTSAELKVKQLVVQKDGQKLELESLSFDILSRQDLKNGKVDIELARLQIPSLLTVDIKGKAENWGKTLDVESKISKVQLESLWKLLPVKFKKGVEDLQIAGVLNLNVKAKGTVPENFDIKNPELPINANIQLDLKNTYIALPSKAIKLENLSTAVQVNFNNGDAEVSGKTSIAKLFLSNILGEAALNPQFNFRYRLQNFNKLIVNEHILTVSNQGIKHSFSGLVDGLKPFITGKYAWDPGELVKRLDVKLAISNRVQLNEMTLKKLNLMEGEFQTNGSLESKLNLNLLAGKEVVVDGEVVFNHFNLVLPDKIALKDLHGKFPFNKKLVLNRALLGPAKPQFRASRKGFFNHLREFSRYKNILTLKQANAGKHKVSNLGLDLLFENNQLLIERFMFNVLNGGVAGNLFLTHPKEGPELKFSTEFAGLNFGSLVGLKEDVESEIDGNVQFGFQIGEGTAGQPISLDQINAKIFITRIGAEVLDRVLLFVDPEESKPAIVDMRAKLKLASPHRLIITLENGNLNVEAWLKNKILGDILKAPELKRVPVSGLKQFKMISEQLQALTGLRDALSSMAARDLEFNEDGKVILY